MAQVAEVLVQAAHHQVRPPAEQFFLHRADVPVAWPLAVLKEDRLPVDHPLRHPLQPLRLDEVARPPRAEAERAPLGVQLPRLPLQPLLPAPLLHAQPEDVVVDLIECHSAGGERPHPVSTPQLFVSGSLAEVARSILGFVAAERPRQSRLLWLGPQLPLSL